MPEQKLVMKAFLEGHKPEPLSRFFHFKDFLKIYLKLRMRVSMSVLNTLNYQLSEFYKR
jgi:hypothetical protein